MLNVFSQTDSQARNLIDALCYELKTAADASLPVEDEKKNANAKTNGPFAAYRKETLEQAIFSQGTWIF